MMDDPAEFPQWIYYFDGYRIKVHTSEALAQMWPGHAKNQSGPFPEMAQGWGWRISHADGWHGGPFAPDQTPYRYVPGLSFEALVYALKPCVVDGVQRDFREVWRGGSGEADTLKDAGVLRLVSHGAQLATFDKNGRCFLDASARDAAARRYESRDLRGFLEVQPPIPSARSRRTKGAPPDYAAWTNTQAMRLLRDAAAKVKRASERLTQETLGRRLSPQRHRNTVREILKYHDIKLTDL